MVNLTGPSILALSLAAMNLATAQNLSYGADNFYRSDNVTLWPITFPTIYHTTVAGNLFLPDFLDYSANNSAIVVSHPMGAVKEQSANLYATKMAEQGFVTVSIDIPFYGGSEGQPINSVLPDLYSEAVSAAVDYLGLRSYVDRRRIGAIGICGSGGFVVSAAKIDPRISAVATASMYDMGAVNRNGLMHSQSVHERKEVIAQAAEQRWVEAAGAETSYQLGTPLHLTNTSTAVDREFYDYYRTSRGKFTPADSAPNMTTGRSATSNTKFMNFYPFDDIDTISPRPLLFITGDIAHSREFSADAYARAAEPKEIMWIPGAGHVDLYDRVDLIPFARLFDFFRTNLAGNSTRLPLN
ncbi:alpha/beta-hydrolase [Hortaea werneckii]|nr:alpha/beta-hydrolase [Hortaea werneckii]KAI6997369.1 alpha/beta-hydrolase [Hortaea werneckii]KAI7148249.1 alpha/beta-hydrolase [Hortaea werneckii]KAI7178092.1 alpha/beta-hydrolase [Hortaea werneckii]